MVKKATKQELEEINERLARVSADYANYRRRTEQTLQQDVLRGKKQLIQDVLAAIDNLELALKQVSTQEQSEFYTGVELIYGQLVSVLESHGVARIETEQFDPAQHEALLTEQSKQPKGTILEVLQPGYRLGTDVLRTAKVKLSSGEKKNE